MRCEGGEGFRERKREGGGGYGGKAGRKIHQYWTKRESFRWAVFKKLLKKEQTYVGMNEKKRQRLQIDRCSKESSGNIYVDHFDLQCVKGA